MEMKYRIVGRLSDFSDSMSVRNLSEQTTYSTSDLKLAFSIFLTWYNIMKLFDHEHIERRRSKACSRHFHQDHLFNPITAGSF